MIANGRCATDYGKLMALTVSTGDPDRLSSADDQATHTCSVHIGRFRTSLYILKIKGNMVVLTDDPHEKYEWGP